MQIFNLFPLTVVKESISLNEVERRILVNEVKKMRKLDNENKESSFAWTGDRYGYEFLFSNDLSSIL